jgi:hypothetical protein
VTKRKHDRDATVDRLLAGMAPGLERPAGSCLDADTLAAWTDHVLDGAERAAAEAHAADCARCQAVLSAMARTEPPSAAAASLWRISSLRWLLPLTAAAAAAIVWAIVPWREEPVNVREVSQIAESIPPAAGPAAGTVPTPPGDNTASDRPRREETSREYKGTPDDKLARASQDAGAASNALDSRNNSRLQDAEPVQPPAPATEAPRAARAPQASPAPAVTSQPPDALPSAAVAARTFSLAAREMVVVSPNPGSRWRILPGGGVQRSADGGATWETQSTGISGTLSAGTSPSPSVCWLVGAGGLVLLSADGRSWRRVDFPETVELVAVRATDDQGATVTTADGREFVTQDGGRTWTRPPGR